jgi:hypothetical protein
VGGHPRLIQREEDGLGLHAGHAEADDVGKPVHGVAVGDHTVERGGRGQGPLGLSPGQGRLRVEPRGQDSGGGTEPHDPGHVLHPRPP